MNTDHTIATPMDNNLALRKHFPILWKVCLLYGICYLLFAYRNSNGIGSGIFALLSCIAFLFVANLLQNENMQTENYRIEIKPECIFYYCAAVLISFTNCLNDSYFFIIFNHIASFLLFSIASMKLFYNDRAWGFGKYAGLLLTFWVHILEVIPVPFKDYFANRNRAEDKKLSSTTRNIILGIVFGLPILFVTTALLTSADQIFSDILGKVFDFSWLKELDWMKEISEHIILLPSGFVIYTLLIYLVFAALCRGKLKTEVKEPVCFGTPIAITIFVMIDIVYVLFSGIQFLFLFAEIPSNYDYAEYARQGFFELLFVALINFFLVLFCNKHFIRNTLLKVVMTITCVCTYVMIVSSGYRMILYIQEYHLTFLRVFVLWFLAMLTFFMTGCTISIYKADWNNFHYCLVVLTCFYTLLAMSGVDGHIADYNVTQFEKDIQVQPTDGPQPYLDLYLPEDYRYSEAYAPYLGRLLRDYGEMLEEKNLTVLTDYLSIREFFYDYDFYGEYHLTEEAKLYDKDFKKSIFSWKHFNFVENRCYKECKQAE